MNKYDAIGFMDSGLGGLTVMQKAIKRLPRENFIYFGDSKNFPYGNRTKDNIYGLGVNILNFLEQKGVKCVCVACNTMSALGESISTGFNFPIIRITDCCAEKLKGVNLSSVGVLGTEFTINSGVYENLIKKNFPGCRTVGISSKNLAWLIENKGAEDAETKAEIRVCMDRMLEKVNVSDIILGCTHYPLAMQIFKEYYPEINFIDPAQAQCDYLENMLKSCGGLNDAGGRLELYTSGNTDTFLAVTDKLGIKRPDILENALV